MRNLLNSCFIFLATLSPASGEETVAIDFGATQSQTVSNWNNITEWSSTDLVLKDARDSTGRETSVCIRQRDSWAGFNIAGHPQVKDFPSTATRDSFFLEQGKDDRAELQIEGLTPGRRYQLTLFASRMQGTKLRAGVYAVGSEKRELNASNNTVRTVTFENIACNQEGKISLVITIAEGHQYAYLGTLQIRGEFDERREIKTPEDSLDGPPFVSAKAWGIADGKTGEFLWGENQAVSRNMASTTKIMTAWIVLELIGNNAERLKEITTISSVADRTGGSTADVRAGEKLSIGDLLYGLLLPSGNDAAVALGEHFGREFAQKPVRGKLSHKESLALFVTEMNARAKALGMKETRYLDPHGNSANRSSARDLLRLAWTCMKNETFRNYVKTARHSCTVQTPDGNSRQVTWKNSNQLLGIAGYDGIKTGTTGGAGACLVSSGHRGDDHLLVVVLGSTSREGRYIDSRNLYRWAWIERGHGKAKSP